MKSVWSISEIEAKDLNKPFSKKPVKSIGYKGGAVNFSGKGKEITWLDAWKCADKLIKESEDDHHIFIEDISEIIPGSGLFTITTGS